MKLVLIALASVALFAPAAANAQSRQYLDAPTPSCEPAAKKAPDLTAIFASERDVIAAVNAYLRGPNLDPKILAQAMVLRSKIRENLAKLERPQADASDQPQSCSSQPQITLIAQVPAH